MENPFNLSDDKLKKLLNAYFDWVNKREVDKNYPIKEKQKSEKWEKILLNKEYLQKVSDNELVKLIIEYSRELEGPANIKIGESKVSSELENIKRNLLYIIDSTDDPFSIAEKIIEGDFRIPVFSKAFWSPLFRAKFPELLPNWNNKTDNFLKKLGVNVTTSKKTIEAKYKLFSNAYIYLKSLDDRYDFYYLDHLTHFGMVIPEGMKLIDDLQFDFNNWVNSEEIQELIKNYTEIRNRKDPELWQEKYKWKVLPDLNEKFFKEPITADNVIEKINLLQKFNPTTGTFVHYTNLGDLDKIAQEKPSIVFDTLLELFEGESPLHERIDNTIKTLRKIKKDAKIGTPLFGYLLAMYDYNKYPLYKDSIFQSLKRNIGKEKEWKSYTLGMKYERFQELCLKMGEYLKNSNMLSDIEVNGIKIPVGITALDGQDFFFYLDKIAKPGNGKSGDNNGTQSKEPEKTIITDVKYTRKEILKEIFISEGEFDGIVRLLKDSKKKQLILQGPPGTGKTFIAQRIARYITQNDNLVETIQFHPSYSYEDFIEGYRPKDSGFELGNGIFKKFCKKAKEDQNNEYVLIIDEINRGNLSKIFGELLFLLEYRKESVQLTYSQEKFSLPDNLYIIGTMNTADRSLAIMDYALRRRFYFKNINCQIDRLKKWLLENHCQISTDKLLDAIKNMNAAIEGSMHCSDYNIGHSYFMREKLDKESLKEIIDFGVEPLLHEYFFDKNERIVQIIAPLKNLLKVENQQNDE
jgi:hypothetical protein